MNKPLELHDVLDRGVPNKERVAIRVHTNFYMQHVWLGIGIKNIANELVPVNDNVLWLGTGWVNAGDWLFVYSGAGEAKTNDIPNQSQKIHTVHWNRSNVLFSSEELYPFLIDGMVTFPRSFQSFNSNDPFASIAPD